MVTTRIQRRTFWFLATLLALGIGFGTRAWAQTPTPTPDGEFLCSAGSRDGRPCNGDDDCPNGVCVIAQGVCDGGTDDGFPCDCAASTCSATPVCTDDATLGTCVGGPSATLCCDVTTNCTDGAPCTASQKVCLGGDNKAFSCLRNDQCPGSVCASTGRFCNGGDFDGFSCVDNADCPNGTCDTFVVATATPTRTVGGPTPTRTRTAAGTFTPTQTPTPITPGQSSPTPTATVLTGVATLANNIAPTDTVIVLDNGSGLPATGGVVQIDAEQISFAGHSGNTLVGVQRGINGTTAEGHLAGTPVFLIQLPTPTATRPIPTFTPRDPEVRVEVTGEGGGCAVAGAGGSAPGAFGLVGLALVLGAIRRR